MKGLTKHRARGLAPSPRQIEHCSVQRWLDRVALKSADVQSEMKKNNPIQIHHKADGHFGIPFCTRSYLPWSISNRSPSADSALYKDQDKFSIVFISFDLDPVGNLILRTSNCAPPPPSTCPVASGRYKRSLWSHTSDLEVVYIFYKTISVQSVGKFAIKRYRGTCSNPIKSFKKNPRRWLFSRAV